MADEQTPTVGYTKPENTASDDTWGLKTNSNWDLADGLQHASTGHKHTGAGNNGPQLEPPALKGVAADGIVTRISATDFINRSIVAQAGLTVNDGDGVAGNPTVGYKLTDLTDFPAPQILDELLIYDTTAAVHKKVQVTNLLRFASEAETTAGVSSDKAVTPQGLSTSQFGMANWQNALDRAQVLAVQTGVFTMVIPDRVKDHKLTGVHAQVITAGTGAVTTFQVHNETTAQDMLSTLLSIDAGETGSDTAATPPVIDPAQAQVALWNRLRVDIAAVATTPPVGLIFTMLFQQT